MDWFRIDDKRTGKPVVMATVSRDLTQQKQVEAELRMLNEGLEKECALRTQALSEANRNLHRVATARSQADARLKELQAELFHAGRLSTMGQLAGALAHELGQPLGAAINYINTARRSHENRGDGADLYARPWTMLLPYCCEPARSYSDCETSWRVSSRSGIPKMSRI